MEDRTCEWCGDTYTPTTSRGRPQRFCTKRCRVDAQIARNAANYKPKPLRFCTSCGCEMPKRRPAAECRDCFTPGPCTVDGCSTVAVSRKLGLCGMHKMRLRIHGSIELPAVFCQQCGSGPLNRKPGFGQPPQFCPSCTYRKVLDNASRQNHIRRSVYSVGDKITIRELGERDGWRCHLCGKKVRKRGGHDRLAPSIDHLIPISADGAHVWENVALAHKGCNASRNNRGAAQLRLIA